MISKSFVALIFLFASVNAQSCLDPALGISGTPGAQDVQKPTEAQPCGNINIAQNLDSSTAIQADQDGKFSPSIISFAAGSAGSQSIATVKVDSSATGDNFVAANMVTNGPSTPAQAGTQQLSAQLPTGIQCTGGTGKNLCLASFITTQGEGNCVVVKGPETSGSQVETKSGPAAGQKKRDSVPPPNKNENSPPPPPKSSPAPPPPESSPPPPSPSPTPYQDKNGNATPNDGKAQPAGGHKRDNVPPPPPKSSPPPPPPAGHKRENVPPPPPKSSPPPPPPAGHKRDNVPPPPPKSSPPPPPPAGHKRGDVPPQNKNENSPPPPPESSPAPPPPESSPPPPSPSPTPHQDNNGNAAPNNGKVQPAVGHKRDNVPPPPPKSSPPPPPPPPSPTPYLNKDGNAAPINGKAQPAAGNKRDNVPPPPPPSPSPYPKKDAPMGRKGGRRSRALRMAAGHI